MRVYTLNAENQTVSSGIGLVAFRTAATVAAASVIRLLRLEITQSGSVTSAQIRGAISTRDTAGTYTMSSATPRPLVPTGGTASGLTGNTAPAGGDGRCGVTSTADSGGTYTDLFPFNFNNLCGYVYVPVPEERIIVPASTVLVVRLLATPTTTTGWTTTLVFEEVY